MVKSKALSIAFLVMSVLACLNMIVLMMFEFLGNPSEEVVRVIPYMFLVSASMALLFIVLFLLFQPVSSAAKERSREDDINNVMTGSLRCIAILGMCKIADRPHHLSDTVRSSATQLHVCRHCGEELPSVVTQIAAKRNFRVEVQ